MQASIKSQLPNLNTGQAKNQRDTVYKSGPVSSYTFYSLYDEISIVLNPIASYKNQTIIDREFKKIQAHCHTIISKFFLPCIERLLTHSEFKDQASEFHSQLNYVKSHFNLSSLKLLTVTEKPVPDDKDMMRYIHSFVSHIIQICPESNLKPSETKLNTTHSFRKPHMLGLSIKSKQSFHNILMSALIKVKIPALNRRQKSKRHHKVSTNSLSESNLLK